MPVMSIFRCRDPWPDIEPERSETGKNEDEKKPGDKPFPRLTPGNSLI